MIPRVPDALGSTCSAVFSAIMTVISGALTFIQVKRRTKTNQDSA